MSGARVLVVEDNRITRKMFRVALESQGWAVLEAEDGAAALAAFEAAPGPPDVVVTDLTLPDVDGATLLARLRRAPGGAAVPVLAVSGFLGKLEDARALALDFVDLLFKPVDPSRLVAAVRAQLETSARDGPGRGRRVVLADDDPIQRRLLAVQLERLGFVVEPVEGGAEALARARAAPPDAIVSDVLMPGVDGFRLCLQVRREPALARLPVVLVSIAFTEEADRELARRVGANALVPRTPEHGAVVEAVLAGLDRAAPLPQAGDPLPPPEEYTHRLIRRLERQVEERADLAQRLALHEAAMGVVARLGETARRSPAPLGELLPELLQYALDAAGVSLGAVFLLEPDGRLVLAARHGFSTANDGLATLYDGEGLLRDAARAGEPRSVPAGEAPTADERALLARAGAGSLLLVPLRYGDLRLGVLVLAAARPRALGESQPFAAAIGAQIAHTVALACSEEELRRTEEHLRQAQRMEAVGRLAGGIAHDFNNLLTVISGYGELLWDGLAQGDPRREAVDQVLLASRRAAGLTRQLLAFSRKQILQPRVLDLNAVVTDMDRLLRRLIGEDVDLRTCCAPGLGRISADPGQLEQVIMNLAVNARDAMPRGGCLTIETKDVELDAAYVATRPDVAPGPYVLLAVSDTGTGMDRATLAHAFEPFFTTKPAGQGTGLGLSTVFGIVKQSGGHVAAYSEPGRGSTLKVYLPRVVGEESSEQAAPAAASAGRAATETVLVVEDDEMVRALVVAVLSRLGYRVLEAPDGLAAERLALDPAARVDLLLTDVVLPRMSGKELRDRLAAARPGLRALYMSGYTDNAIVHHGVLDEGTPFLHKPFTGDALAARVRAVLDAPA